MELWLPEQIGIDSTSASLMADVEETARRVNEHRPFPPEIVRRIEDDLLGERVYGSNAIEGNTLDLRETVMVLRQGIQGIRKKREAREAANLGEAVRIADAWISNGTAFHSTEHMLKLHAQLLIDINDDWGGRIRDRQVMIQGARHQPPDHSLVPSLLDRVLNQLSQPAVDNVQLNATWAHWAIARIHPFFDGNGRMARLWQDLVLIKGRHTCAIILPEGRSEYLKALMTADEGDFNPLMQLVARRVSSTFDRYLAELGKTSEFEEWVREVAGEVDERAAERSRLEYERWRRRMEQLRREFELCAAKITGASQTVRIQVTPYPIVDQAQWQNIRDGIGASQTWMFRLDMYGPTQRLRYIFFFGKHFWNEDLDTERDRAEKRVTLLISEDDRNGNAERLDKIEGCPLSIREVFVTDDCFVCRRFDPLTGEASYDRGMSALQIAQEFIRDVIYNRLSAGQRKS